MTEQTKIIAQIHELIMGILKTGSATVEQGDKIDELEELLFEQKCFKEIGSASHANQGEEIASLFFTDSKKEAIDKMIECEITPEDFFGFVEYHYDEDHKDEDKIKMFTGTFMADVNKVYESK